MFSGAGAHAFSTAEDYDPKTYLPPETFRENNLACIALIIAHEAVHSTKSYFGLPNPEEEDSTVKINDACFSGCMLATPYVNDQGAGFVPWKGKHPWPFL